MRKERFYHKIESEHKIGEFLGHSDEVRVILFSHDQDLLFTGSWDTKILVYCVKKYNSANSFDTKCLPKFILKGHTAGITALGICPHQKNLISGAKDGLIKVWSLDQEKCNLTLKKHEGRIFTIVIDPTCTYLASGGADKKIHIGKIERYTKGDEWNSIDIIKTIDQVEATIHVLRFNHKGNLLASLGDEKTIYVWDFPSGKLRLKFKEHKKIPYALEFHPTEEIIISAGNDKKIYIWAIKGNKEIILKTLSVPSPIIQIKFYPDGNYFLTVDLNNDVKIYETDTCILLQTHHFKQGTRLTMGISNDWNLFAISPFENNPPKVRVWAFVDKKESNR